MRPTLLSFHLPLVGEVAFPAYFTLLTLGFAVAMWMTWRESKRIRLDPDLIIDTNLWMVIWGILGARALHVLADGHFTDYVNLCLDPTKVKALDAQVGYCVNSGECAPEVSAWFFWKELPYACDLATHTCHPVRDCFAALEVWRGGLAYYGGFLFAVAFGVWFVRRSGMPLPRVADLSAPAIPMGLFFGRLGCFFNGCCYGKLASGPVGGALGVVFPRGSDAWRAQVESGLIRSAESAHAVLPTQLFESFGSLAVSAALYFVVRPRKQHDGEVWAWLLILYALLRSAIEVFRDDERGVFFGGWLSTSQIISIPLALVGVGLLVWLRRKAPTRA